MTDLIRRVLVATLLGVLLYSGFVIYSGYRDIQETLLEFRWLTFGFALMLSSTNYFLRFLKWEYYLDRLQVKGVRKSDSLAIFLSGFVLTISPGKVGEVFKSAVLKRTHGVASSRTAPIVVAERLTDVLAIVILITLGSLSFDGGFLWAGIGAGLVTIVLVLILWERPSLWFIAQLRARQRVARLAPKLEQAFASLRILANPAALPIPTARSVVGWGCEAYAFYLLLGGLGAECTLGLATFFYATSTLAGAVIPVPGGLGVTEAMIRGQLVGLGGTTTAVATAAMILVRFATLWWAVLVGFMALGWVQVRFPSLFKEPLEGASEPAKAR